MLLAVVVFIVAGVAAAEAEAEAAAGRGKREEGGDGSEGRCGEGCGERRGGTVRDLYEVCVALVTGEWVG